MKEKENFFRSLRSLWSLMASLLAVAGVLTPNATYASLETAFEHLPYEPPWTDGANTLKSMANGDPARERVIQKFAAETAPFLHSRTLTLLRAFLTLKLEHGSSVERTEYTSLTVTDFITRLTTRRPLTFESASDTYKLKTGEMGQGHPPATEVDRFHAIGTANETRPLVLQDYLSYDEMEVSAMLGISVPTFLINVCDRDNLGFAGLPGTFEEQGVIIDQVGCRFERPGRMEWQHMVVTPTQNVPEHGYGASTAAGYKASPLLNLWASFYSWGGVFQVGGTATEPPRFPTFEEATHSSERNASWWEVLPPIATKAPSGGLLNVAAFRSRYLLQATALLARCSTLGLEPGMTGAFCSVAEAFEEEP